MIDRTGWTMEDVDRLTLSDLEDLQAHWAEEPPVSDVIRAWVGWKPAEGEQHGDRPKAVTEEEFRQIVAGLQADAEQHGRPR